MSGQTFTIPEGDEERRIDRIIRLRFPGTSLSRIYRLIRTGGVRVNDGKCKPSTKVQTGDRITVPASLATSGPPRTVPPATRMDIRVLVEDEDILVLEKPPGLVVHPGSKHTSNTVESQAILHLYRADRKGEVHLVHRLDRNTSGLLVLARHARAARALSKAIKEGRWEKEYLALVVGKPDGKGEVRVPLRGQSAHTTFRRLATGQGFSLLQVRIETGRTHQIRAHLRFIGHPVVGDPRYGEGRLNREVRERYGLRRQFLHACRLRFSHPETGEPLEVRSPLAPDLERALDRMGISLPPTVGER